MHQCVLNTQTKPHVSVNWQPFWKQPQKPSSPCPLDLHVHLPLTGGPLPHALSQLQPEPGEHKHSYIGPTGDTVSTAHSFSVSNTSSVHLAQLLVHCRHRRDSLSWTTTEEELSAQEQTHAEPSVVSALHSMSRRNSLKETSSQYKGNECLTAVGYLRTGETRRNGKGAMTSNLKTCN